MASRKKGHPGGGIKAAAELLAQLDPSSRERILAEMARKDPAITSQVAQQMFTLESLVQLDAREFQLLLSQIPQPRLATALRKCPAEFKNRVFESLPKDRAQLLREELENQGLKKLSEVTVAQAEILQIAKRLMSECKIQLKN